MMNYQIQNQLSLRITLLKRVCGMYYALKLCIKGLFLVPSSGGLFLAFQISLFEFGFYLLLLHLCIEDSVVDTLRQLILTLSSL